MKLITTLLSTAVPLALPLTAHAHTGLAGHTFSDGFIHPFIGLDHTLAMLAVGIWGAMRCHHAWSAPLCFILLLSLGVLAGQNGLSMPYLEPVLAASVLIFGLLLALPLYGIAPLPMLTIGAFAFCHGMAHGNELTASSVVLSGIIMGSAMLHALGIAGAVIVLQKRPQQTRHLGRLIVLCGGVLFASRLL